MLEFIIIIFIFIYYSALQGMPLKYVSCLERKMVLTVLVLSF